MALHVGASAARAARVTLIVALAWLPARDGFAQSSTTTPHDASSPQEAQRTVAPSTPIACESKPGERIHCDANVSGGVILVRSTGTAECLLGKSWGYDQTGVWVSDGCSAQFMLGQPSGAEAAKEAATGTPAGGTPAAPSPPQPKEIESWGEFSPGDGFVVGRSSAGALSISGYALARYMNQMPGDGTFTDHLGNVRPVDGRNDIYSHRVMVFFKGWLGTPKLLYNITLWTVNTTDQRAIFGVLGYQFHRKFSVYTGLNGNPGTRSLQGSHPFWLAPDRVMADEFFRPFFGSGVWAQGEIFPGLWYNAVLTTSSSSLGVKATQLDRDYSTGASMWWMPTTKEFGPRGAYGDWEQHEKVATRFGFSTTRSPEERFTDSVTGNSTNTTIRLADSVNVFEKGALARDVTVDRVNYQILAFDAGVKYRGIFFQTEIYNRWLDSFKADGPLPVASVHDSGFFIQGAFYPIPKKLELYAVTSQIFGDKTAGFGNSSEYIGGMNYYPFNTRNHRLNFQVIDVNRSPVSSTFGYYVAGQKGTTVSAAFSVFF